MGAWEREFLVEWWVEALLKFEALIESPSLNEDATRKRVAFFRSRVFLVWPILKLFDKNFCRGC